MAEPFRTTRRVEFHDTDMGGMMHFTAFFKYMEATEHALLRDLGMSVFPPAPEGSISWPRVSATCQFRAPVRFEDVLEIEASVVELGEKSVTYNFQFSHDGQLMAEGRLTSVCCQIEAGRSLKSVPIPTATAQKLKKVMNGG